MNQSNEDSLIELMAECSDQIIAGATVASCLARHPEQAVALEPLLSAVTEIRQFRTVPARSATVAAQRRAAFIAAASQLAPIPATPASWPQQLGAWWRRLLAGFTDTMRGWEQPRAMPAGLAFALLAVVLAGALATGAVSASAKALPGDFLYPVKTAAEGAWVWVTRDPVERANVVEQITDRRVDEALTIVRIGRPVRSLTLAGIIEAIDELSWVISGQTVTLTAETRIEGQPAVGARVQGLMTAPGDGRLLVTSVRIEASVPEPAPAAAPMPTAIRPTAAPAPTDLAPAGVALPTQAHVEPTDRPSQTPSATPSITPTSTRTRMPTKTPRPTRQATATPIASLTPPRPEINQTFYGWVKAISDNRWTVDTITVEVDSNTQYLGTPGLGWEVQVNALVRADGSYLARQIIGLRGPTAPPEPLEFVGAVSAIEGPWWTIGPYRVKVDEETLLEGDPQIGDRVQVKAERRAGGEIWARKITALLYVERQFEGVVTALSTDTIDVDGYTLIIDSATQIIGQVAVGVTVQVAAWEMPDGQLVARIIMAVEPEPTATDAPMSTATLTPTLPITGTPTPTATVSTASSNPGTPSPTAPDALTP